MSEKFEWFVEASDMQDAIEWFSEAHDANGYKKQRPRSNYRVTVERIDPEPEQPQWHYWNPYGWQDPTLKPLRPYVFFDGYDFSGQVWGTVSDRDAKRDALLAAARAAGKPEDTDHA